MRHNSRRHNVREAFLNWPILLEHPDISSVRVEWLSMRTSLLQKNLDALLYGEVKTQLFCVGCQSRMHGAGADVQNSSWLEQHRGLLRVKHFNDFYGCTARTSIMERKPTKTVSFFPAAPG